MRNLSWRFGERFKAPLHFVHIKALLGILTGEKFYVRHLSNKIAATGLSNGAGQFMCDILLIIIYLTKNNIGVVWTLVPIDV